MLLFEAGPYKTAADYMRWEAHATHEMWWPIAFAEPPAPGHAAAADVPRPLRRRHDHDQHEGGAAPGRPRLREVARRRRAGRTTPAQPFGEADLLPYLERVEQRLGVRERNDWQKCVHTVAPAFEKLGAPLESVMSYTDANCMRCGSCLQGCPTNAGKSTLNTYIQPALVQARP